jgi:hypothetical protein
LLDEVAERDVLPPFRKLFSLREAMGPDVGPILPDIQARLRALVASES